MPLRPFVSAAVVAAAAVLLLTPSARAAAPGATQVTGRELGRALLPASDFGARYSTVDEIDSGNVLELPQTVNRVSTMSCRTFISGGGGFGAIGFGETAVATASMQTPNDDEPIYDQTVYQFPNAKTGQSFYAAIAAKYGKCGPSTVPDVGAPGTMTTRTVSVKRTHVDGHPAFSVFQTSTFSGAPSGAAPLSIYWMFATDGTDVFIFDAYGGNGSSLPGLTARLIARVSALRSPLIIASAASPAE
jgi:hypothetical protein